MMSVPGHWSELYFNIFAILCISEVSFLIWYEITHRAERSDPIGIAVSVALDSGAVGVAAAIQTFVLLKVRDLIMMTWERYKEERYEKGREEGRREVIDEIRQAVEQNGNGKGRDLLKEILGKTENEAEKEAQRDKDRDLLDKLLAVVREADEERDL